MPDGQDLVAVVTGGGSGIGKATCDRLRQDGFRLGVFDLEAGPAIKAAGEDGLGLGVDVSDQEAVDEGFGAVEDRLGPVGVLVNNAGITGSASASRLGDTPAEEWDQVMAVNVRGAYLCSRSALKRMVPRRAGHIITVASVAGIVPFPARAAYSVSKAAALGLARSIAIDYAADGIISNAVCPGMTETPMTRWRLDQPELREAIESRIPVGRVAQPEEIAQAIAVLASGGLSYLTGHGLVVDGGWSAL
ncbi:MAG: SDR family oxidoreductase [Acidimicrobiia bacterium]|nr:SDR family oxidoreductase [bacterium]MXX64372.1 SDR family oxidoreductase [Acidimicrobiia bacterium]MCY3580312.1 SDR family oxidoreductase [bacterium]MCY3653100.1 SDR family oxidoreductase [bacterium]MDE0643612.1 SDR family oxidoreductase [bacterium]